MKAETFAEPALHADLLRIWSHLLETTDLSIDDDFFDKGGDSLLATDLMLELERLIGKPLPQTLLFEVSTIRTLTDRLTRAQELQLNPAVRIGTVSSGETPILFFHGDWTAGGFYVQNLARKLGPDLSIIAIAPHGMHGELMPSSIEAMAADRLPAIIEAQPRGPYRLGGHCVGAAVAFETARLLMEKGHQVELVAMVDPLCIVDGEILKMIRESAESETELFNTECAATALPDLRGNPIVLEQYREVLIRYCPSPLSVPLIIFTSEFDGRPWCRLGRDYEICEIVGGHYDWLTLRADAFTDKLKARLRRIRMAVEGPN